MFSLEAEERLQKQLLDDVMTEALHKEKNGVRPQANQIITVVFTVQISIALCVQRVFLVITFFCIHGQLIFCKHLTLID
jgi:hypothetical protein